MSTLVDRLSQQRRTILIGSLIGFALSYGAMLLRDAFAARSVLKLIVEALGLAGWAVCVQVLVILTGLQRGSELTIYVGVLTALGIFLYLDRD